mmetsp:Transcript_27201/g.76016  ORF Transcript_27201/g.76016 Transcript_27201/m.76016 type:complete len:215 (-) Transcript_27201:304-948(-)
MVGKEVYSFCSSLGASDDSLFSSFFSASASIGGSALNATRTASSRPSTSLPSMALRAACWSSLFLKTTNPYPLLRPDRPATTCATLALWSPKMFFSSSLPTENGKLATNRVVSDNSLSSSFSEAARPRPRPRPRERPRPPARERPRPRGISSSSSPSPSPFFRRFFFPARLPAPPSSTTTLAISTLIARPSSSFLFKASRAFSASACVAMVTKP